MTTEFENGEDELNGETRQKLKDLSRTFLQLHKNLLEGAKMEYEAKNGAIAGANQYLQLVLDDPHFAWLRKISSMIALIDEAVSMRRAASEPQALALLNEVKLLLNFEDADEDFNREFQTALQKNADAVLSYNAALNSVV
jgi:hypothetical protein